MHVNLHDRSSQDPHLVSKLQDAEQKAIAEVVAQQVKRGIVPITSGEIDRPSFVSGFYEALEGVEIRNLPRTDFRTEHPIMRPYIRMGIDGRDQPVATGKIKFKQSAYMNEWLYVRSLIPEELWKNVKITIPSPSWSQQQLKDGLQYVEGTYSDDLECLRDIGEAMRQEILALYEAGV